MITRRLAIAAVGLLALVAAGCEQLGLVENNRTRIRGGWYLIERSFPTGSPHEFDSGVISVDDVEVGSYRFEAYDRIEVTFDGGPTMYEIRFPDTRTMEWYRPTASGQVKVREWRRAED